MASSVAFNVAQEHLGELLDRAERGEEIVIERDGRVAMRLVPEITASVRRIGGQNLLGIRYVSEDFDAPMTEPELQAWEG